MNRYKKVISAEFSPSESTPCWSAYVASQHTTGSVRAEGHGYGKTRDEAIEAASYDLDRKIRISQRGH